MAFGIEGVLIGHADDEVGLTGCTVVLLPAGSKGGGEVQGGAPGTRETDLLKPANLVEEVNAFLLAGEAPSVLPLPTGSSSTSKSKGSVFRQAWPMFQ